MKVDVEGLIKLLASIRDSANAKAAGHGPILEAAIEVIARQSHELAALRKALSFYADPKRHQGPNQHLGPGETDPWKPDSVYIWDVTRDDGAIARKALRDAD
jgi:hypothetical protein